MEIVDVFYDERKEDKFGDEVYENLVTYVKASIKPIRQRIL